MSRRRRTLLLAGTIASLSLGASPADAATFKSPSGNIGCAIDAGGVRCDIRAHAWRPPPKPASCQLDWGNGLTLGKRGRARFTCAGDTLLGAGGVLAYGRDIGRGRFRCLSRRRGVRCFNRRNGHGFALSRQAARRF